MICPDCGGNGFIKISGTSPDWESNQNAQEKEITCPTCEGEGDGEIPATPAAKHCPACGEPLKGEQTWCDEHKAAALFEVPTYPALCVICNGKGFNEIREYSYANLKFETKQIPCADCDGSGDRISASAKVEES